MEWANNFFGRLAEWCKATIVSDRSWRGTSLWLGLSGIPLGAFGFGMINTASSMRAMPFHGAERLSGLVFIVGVFIAVVGPLLIVVSVFGIAGTQLDKQKVNIVAWRGYDDPAIRGLLPAHVEPLIVEYVRGIHRVETLRLNDEPVGVLISDAEYLREHHQGEYLDPIRIKARWEEKLEKPFHHTNPQWRDRVGVDKAKVLGVPIRWAINDLIFNAKKAAAAGYRLDKAEDYADFNLTDLLNTPGGRCKIGLWNWFLPTLQLLLLCEDRTLDVRKVHESKVWVDLTESSVESVARIIKGNAGRFVVLDSPSEVRESLIEDDGCWLVYGAGSWALSLSEFGHPDIRKVVPARGVTSWVECLTFPAPGLNERPLRKKFVDAFLSPEMQKVLTESKEYLSAPVTDAAIGHIAGLLRKKSPDAGEQRLTCYVKYLTETGFIDHRHNIVADALIPRKLPDEWASWDSIWRDVIATVRAAN